MARNVVQFQKGLSEPAFEQQYGTEEQCRAVVIASRWPNGFECPVCGCRQHSPVTTRDLYQCARRRRQTSPIAGTIFASTHLPLRLWFRAIYHLTQTKQGISSIELDRRLGVTQTTAWKIKHKLKQVMLERDASERLAGRIEIDDAYLGGERHGGKRSRGRWTITNSRLSGMTYKSLRFCATALIVAGFAFGGMPHADARKAEKEDRFVPNDTQGTPLLAVVGLAEQRISIYDAKGKIMESPVSSGQTAYETPAGIYSIVQKEEEHHSNLYDDASMPFMERITWTGMALHAGVLPGYAASHGCVRLPHDFAERLYDVTNMGMRVVVAREDITPAEVSQPFMFGSMKQKGPGADRSLREGISPTRYSPSASDDALSQLRMTLAQRSADAQNAARKVKGLRLAASKSNTEAASAARSLQAVESNFAKAEADVKAVEQALKRLPLRRWRS